MIEELHKICKVYEDVDMTNYNTYRLHTKSKCIVFPSSIDELKNVLNVVKSNNVKHFILGNGSNVILPNYYDGVIIKLENFNNYKIYEDYVYAECGCMINNLATKLVNMGYSSLEWATGIPGTIGGCVYNNAGAYNSSVSEILLTAEVFDGEKIIEYSNDDLKFDYRYSIFKSNKNLIVLSCKLKIVKSDADSLKAIVTERTNRRLATQDLSHPSCGSVFRNPEGFAAGKLIDDAGLKGYTIGGASVSNKHANFIINTNNATYTDIIKLINYIKKQIKKIYNIDLVVEQQIIK